MEKTEEEKNNMKREVTGRNSKTGRRKHKKNGRKWMILKETGRNMKKHEETGRNRKKQEETGKKTP